MISTSVANANNFFDDKFNCEDHYGATGGLLAGAYTVDVDLLGPGDASIGSIQPLVNRTIGTQNQFTDLGNITIPVD